MTKNTSTILSIDEILWRLQRLSEPNGLITSDIRWAKEQLESLIQTHTRLAIIEELENLIYPVSNIELMKPKKPFSWGVDTWTHEVPVLPRMYIDDRITQLKSKEGEQLVGCSECGVFAKNEAELMEHKVMRHPKWSKL